MVVAGVRNVWRISAVRGVFRSAVGSWRGAAVPAMCTNKKPAFSPPTVVPTVGTATGAAAGGAKSKGSRKGHAPSALKKGAGIGRTRTIQASYRKPRKRFRKMLTLMGLPSIAKIHYFHAHEFSFI